MKRTECRHAKVSVTEAGTLQYLLMMFLDQPVSHQETQSYEKCLIFRNKEVIHIYIYAAVGSKGMEGWGEMGAYTRLNTSLPKSDSCN